MSKLKRIKVVLAALVLTIISVPPTVVFAEASVEGLCPNVYMENMPFDYSLPFKLPF